MSETTNNPISEGENTPESRNLESIQREVERKELQKKFDSQKKEIKTKLEEANKALNENIKEVEADYGSTLKGSQRGNRTPITQSVPQGQKQAPRRKRLMHHLGRRMPDGGFANVTLGNNVYRPGPDTASP